MAMNFEQFVRTWSRNDFRRMVEGTKINKDELAGKMRAYAKIKNATPVPVEPEKIIFQVAVDKGFVR